MTCELGSIPPNKQKRAPKSCVKWKAFIGRNGLGQGNYQQKKRLLRQGLLSKVEARGPMQSTSLVLIWKFQTNGFKIPLLGELKLQLD